MIGTPEKRKRSIPGRRRRKNRKNAAFNAGRRKDKISLHPRRRRQLHELRNRNARIAVIRRIRIQMKNSNLGSSGLTSRRNGNPPPAAGKLTGPPFRLYSRNGTGTIRSGRKDRDRKLRKKKNARWIATGRRDEGAISLANV
jgi:hypothetical protein